MADVPSKAQRGGAKPARGSAGARLRSWLLSLLATLLMVVKYVTASIKRDRNAFWIGVSTVAMVRRGGGGDRAAHA